MAFPSNCAYLTASVSVASVTASSTGSSTGRAGSSATSIIPVREAIASSPPFSIYSSTFEIILTVDTSTEPSALTVSPIPENARLAASPTAITALGLNHIM